MRAFHFHIIAAMISGVAAAYVDVECLWSSKTGSTYGTTLGFKAISHYF